MNTIEYSAIFNRVLDEKFAILSRTANLTNNTLGIIWNGGREIKVPKLASQGLGNVTGCEIPNGDVEFSYETHQLQYDRGRKFSIGRYDVDETNFTLTAGNILADFYKQSVIPEVDKLRLSNIAGKAIDAGNVVYEGSSVSATPVKDLISDMALVQDKIGEDKPLMIFCSTPFKARLMASNEIVKHLGVREETRGNVNVKIETFNDAEIIAVPSSYCYSAFDAYDGTTAGQESGGLVPSADAKQWNYIIVAKNTVVAVGYPRVEKIFTPDQDQTGDCWRILTRIRHGVIIPDNKVDGLLVNCKGTN